MSNSNTKLTSFFGTVWNYGEIDSMMIVFIVNLAIAFKSMSLHASQLLDVVRCAQDAGLQDHAKFLLSNSI